MGWGSVNSCCRADLCRTLTGSAATQSAPLMAKPASSLLELLSHGWRRLGLSQTSLQSAPRTALSGGHTDHTTLAWWHARWQAALSGLHPKCNKLLQIMHKTGSAGMPRKPCPNLVTRLVNCKSD